MIILHLPVPPSANNLFASGRHCRYKTRKYKQWIEAAGKEILVHRPQPVLGRYFLRIALPKIKGDPDNRIKAISDLLVSMMLIEDDSQKYCAGLDVLVRPNIDDGIAVISVVSAS